MNSELIEYWGGFKIREAFDQALPSSYAYDRLDNIAGRTGTDPDMTYNYGVGPAGPQAGTATRPHLGLCWHHEI